MFHKLNISKHIDIYLQKLILINRLDLVRETSNYAIYKEHSFVFSRMPILTLYPLLDLICRLLFYDTVRWTSRVKFDFFIYASKISRAGDKVAQKPALICYLIRI